MSSNYAITEETLTTDVHHIVYDSDLRKITQRSVFQRLEDKYGIILNQFKPFIYERAVEEARLRIQKSPELQKQQQMSNPKYYYHGDINTQQQRKYYNTIYNTPTSYHLQSQHPQRTQNINTYNKLRAPINYQDVKKHYIGGNGGNHNRKRLLSVDHNNSDLSVDDDNDDNDDDESSCNSNEPPSKRRRYNILQRYNECISPRKTSSAQSTREADKDTEYEFSVEFKEMMGKQRGTWRECWQWITEYAKLNDLRIGNRKIRCDHVLKKAFNRDESSVSGVSRLIWKHLIGAVELDENGNFKKLVYRKRKKTKKGDTMQMIKESNKNEIGSNDDDEDEDEEDDDDEEDEDDDINISDDGYKQQQQHQQYQHQQYQQQQQQQQYDINNNNNHQHQGINNIHNNYGYNMYRYNVINTGITPNFLMKNVCNNNNGTKEENKKDGEGEIAPVRQKRRYRKRLRDENGQIIKKRKKSGLTRLCFMSQALKDIVGKNEPLARNKITKGFWDYTEVNGLKKKGRIIVCDDKLKKIWGDNITEIHMYSVQKGLKEHITTMSKEEEKKYKEENPHLFMDEIEDNNKEKIKKKKEDNNNNKKKKDGKQNII